ncbi:chitin deacetylase [Lichtheimia hyalospora FSU 10163]|nr:chitin deacetylase [Lichtheimia hyalospora FSU 10163]
MANAAEYWESWSSKVDPNKITIPKIKQTSSHDETTQCTPYDASASFEFDPKEWPTTWEVATSNGMDKSAEFTALVKSIPWKNMPDIPVRELTEDGGVNMTDYDPEDPDCWWSATTCTKPKHKGINADIYRCPEPETWGLTFDDGPNCSHNAFYDFLQQDMKVKATMFYIGSNVINWPYGAMRGVKDGHHIAQHTWSHQMMTTLSNEEVLAELYYTQKAIKSVSGITPKHWRPAFGDVDDRVRWIATQLNLTTILWDLDTDDWAAGAEEPMSTVKKHYEDFIKMGKNGTYAKHGNIVLQHEIDATTMNLAMEYLPKIKKNYKHVVDVATCMNITHPYMEKTVTFPTFAKATNTSSSSTNSTTPKKTSSASSSSQEPSSTETSVSNKASSSKQEDEESSGSMTSPENLILAAAAIFSALLV